jgi:glycosyltransferase involved in cell wall biosynthesis
MKRRILHLVVTGSFAGVERYVCDVATETHSRGQDVTVVGGRPDRMRIELPPGVAWRPGTTVPQAIRSVVRSGRHDVCHVHMTQAELVGVLTRRIHGAGIVATRHFAGPRGSSRLGALLAPWISRHVDLEISISGFVASRMERSPGAVLVNGASPRAAAWKASSRTVLLLQRLEREKDTDVAIRGWAESGLAANGWDLRIVGDGAQRDALQRLAVDVGAERISFVGRQRDVDAEFARAGFLLAPAPSEPLGLSVIEAMAAGVPVVASAAGGHLETIGRVREASRFPPGDVQAAAEAMRTLAEDPDRRARESEAVRAVHADHLTVDAHVERLLELYDRTSQLPRARWLTRS